MEQLTDPSNWNGLTWCAVGIVGIAFVAWLYRLISKICFLCFIGGGYTGGHTKLQLWRAYEDIKTEYNSANSHTSTGFGGFDGGGSDGGGGD